MIRFDGTESSKPGGPTDPHTVTGAAVWLVTRVARVLYPAPGDVK
jgi:hypothetical protein